MIEKSEQIYRTSKPKTNMINMEESAEVGQLKCELEKARNHITTLNQQLKDKVNRIFD
jgi:hypothetical protein